MALQQELRQRVLPVVLLAAVFLAATEYVPGSGPAPPLSEEGQQIAKILGVKKVLRSPYFVSSRYPLIHYFTLYIAIRTSDRTYCAEYETPVLDEIDDLFYTKGKDVAIVLKGKNLTLRTPKGRKLKARLVKQTQC